MFGQQINLVEIAEKPEWKQLIYDIVQKEQMDPWDIDLASITSEFLAELKKKQKLNLKISANVMLAASILLRCKSDTVDLHRIEDSEIAGAVFIPDEVYVQDIVPELEASIRNTTRKVTLDELISAVEDIIQKEKDRAVKQRMKIEKVIPQSLLDMAMSNPENFEKELKRTFARIRNEANGENLAMFSNLLEEKSTAGVIALLIPLLHLANKEKISMWQEEIFGEIFMSPLIKEYEN